MGINISRRVASAAAAAVVSGLVLAGCATGDGWMESEETSAPMTASEMESSPSSETGEAMADPAGMMVGAGCSEYAVANPEGPGSVDGMAQEPVATAASNNPLLTTDRKSTRLNSSHVSISYAVFC